MNRAAVITLTIAALATAIPVTAASPGGVEGTEAWFKTAYDYSTRKYRWRDVSGNGLKLYSRGADALSREFLTDSYGVINYHWAVDFSATDSVKWFSLANAPLNQSTIIGVYRPSSISPEGALYSFASADGKGSSVTDLNTYGISNADGTDDGIHDDGPSRRSRFSYDGGRYDRYERMFYGFGSVCESQLDDYGETYRNAIGEYDVTDYYGRGNLLKSYVTDSEGRRYSMTRYAYNRRTATPDEYGPDGIVLSYRFGNLTGSARSEKHPVHVPLTYAADYAFDSNTGDSVIVAERCDIFSMRGRGELSESLFSSRGNLASGSPEDCDSRTTYSYTSSPDHHIFSLPTVVKVTAADTAQILSQTKVIYDPGHPGHVMNFIKKNGSSAPAVTDYTYDIHGNVTSVLLPQNAAGQRMKYEYTYDSKGMYIVKTTDSYGYVSEVTDIDYRYGIVLSRTDIRGNVYSVQLDNIGRTVAVLEPNATGEGARKLIEYDYCQFAGMAGDSITALAYAVTARYDAFRSRPEKGEFQYIRSAALVDGFGRTVQVRKDAETSWSGPLTRGQVIVASGRVVYDAWGRAVMTYYPVDDTTTDDVSVFCRRFDTTNPTLTSYDVLDRVLSTEIPTGDRTVTAYGISANAVQDHPSVVTTVTDANGHRHVQFADGAGRVLLSREFNDSEQNVDTRFSYDGLGRVVCVTDAEGNETRSEYDRLGRRLSVSHPASGLRPDNFQLRSRRQSAVAPDGESRRKGRLDKVRISLRPTYGSSLSTTSGEQCALSLW